MGCSTCGTSVTATPSSNPATTIVNNTQIQNPDTNRCDCGIQRIISLHTPIRFTSIVVLDEAKKDVTTKCLFSWSTDGVCWTTWAKYGEYQTLAKNITGDFYVRILVSVITQHIFINGTSVTDYSVCLYNAGENLFKQDLCTDCTVDFYSSLDCALNLQEQLSNSIICMLGIPCYYIKVEPDKETKDLTFKEFTLHNVTDIRYMKLMLTDGGLPSTNPQMTEFDFDWQNDWEVEMGRRDFAKAFGDNAFPKQRDIIYVPMLKRMYEVNSAYDEKQEGLMFRSTTWKLGLVKYNEKGNVEQGAFENVIDNWVANTYDDIFTYNEREEQRRETGAAQVDTPRYTPNNLYSTVVTDPLRAFTSTISPSATPYQELSSNGVIVSRNYYNFPSDGVITYKPRYCGENGTMILLFYNHSTSETPHLIAEFGNIGIYCYSEYIPETHSRIPCFYIDNVKHPMGSDMLELKHRMRGIVMDEPKILVYRWNKNNYISDTKLFIIPKQPLYRRKYTECADHNLVAGYNATYENNCQNIVKLYPYNLQVANFKLYDVYLNDEDLLEEMLKYTTNNEHCVICDNARPFEGGKGFLPR